MIDECITWKDHIKTVGNKIVKNIGLLYRPKLFLHTSFLKSIYFSYVHTYLNYANIAWPGTQKTKLKVINIKQKHAVRIIFNEDRLCYSRPLLKTLNTLNVYQLNIYQNLNFMHRLKTIIFLRSLQNYLKRQNTDTQQYPSFQKTAIPQNHSL